MSSMPRRSCWREVPGLSTRRRAASPIPPHGNVVPTRPGPGAARPRVPHGDLEGQAGTFSGFRGCRADCGGLSWSSPLRPTTDGRLPLVKICVRHGEPHGKLDLVEICRRPRWLRLLGRPRRVGFARRAFWSRFWLGHDGRAKSLHPDHTHCRARIEYSSFTGARHVRQQILTKRRPLGIRPSSYGPSRPAQGTCHRGRAKS